MTLVTLLPNATSANSGALTGAATAHEALDDTSSASYVSYDFNESSTLTFGDLSLPAGAVIKSASIAASDRTTTAVKTLYVEATGLGQVSPTVPWLAFTSHSFVPLNAFGNPWAPSDADLDALTIFIRNNTSGSGAIEVSFLAARVTYVVPPVTNVDAPTGTVGDTNLPTVEWSNTLDTDGGAQTRYEVKVFTDAQYSAGGFDPDTSTPFDTSGIVSSAAGSWTPTVIQPDDTYRAYVRVAQTVNGSLLWSDWDFGDYTVDVALPAVPTVLATAENDDARVRIDLTANSGDATTDQFEVQRSDDGGTTWTAIRTVLGSGLVDDADNVIYDWEAPNGVTLRYRARALHDYSGVNAASEWFEFVDLSWESPSWWIKHPTRPELNLAVDVHSFPTTTRAARQGVIQPIGAAFPIVVTDTPASVTATIVLRIDDAADRAALDELLATGDTLLLQAPASHDEPDRYVRFGDHDRTRVADKAFVTYRFETLPFVEVVRPTDNLPDWDAS